MIIEEKDFRLTPISDGSPFYDLELLKVVKPKSGEVREEFQNAGYGITMEHAMRKIINYRISCKHESLSMKEYLSEYKKEVNQINAALETIKG